MCARPDVRRAVQGDTDAIAVVEREARGILVAHGIALDDLTVPRGLDEPAGWTLAIVADAGGRVVGAARLTELTARLICLDQVSALPEVAGRGVGRRLLETVVEEARGAGYTAITGTTFRHVAFNGPFYASLGGVEDPVPHPAMLQRRRVEQVLGLDRLGERLVMRVEL